MRKIKIITMVFIVISICMSSFVVALCNDDILYDAPLISNNVDKPLNEPILRAVRTKTFQGNSMQKGIIGEYFPIANNLDIVLRAPSGYVLNSSQQTDFTTVGTMGYGVLNTYVSTSNAHQFLFEMRSNILAYWGLDAIDWRISYSNGSLTSWSPSGYYNNPSGSNVSIPVSLSGINASYNIGTARSSLSASGGSYSYSTSYKAYDKQLHLQNLNALTSYLINCYTTWSWYWSWGYFL